MYDDKLSRHEFIKAFKDLKHISHDADELETIFDNLYAQYFKTNMTAAQEGQDEYLNILFLKQMMLGAVKNDFRSANL